MISYHCKPLALLTMLCVVLALSATCEAKKIYTANPGCVFLSTGDSIVADGNMKISDALKKKKKLELIENPYTKQNRVRRRISPTDIDSVRIWSPSAPEHTHKLVYIPRYGWCWEAEHGPHICVYGYSPKGYHLSGNGGLWLRNKGKIFIIKDGRIYDFGAPDGKINSKMRKELEALVADDPYCLQYVREAKGRRDKILRSLVLYSPAKQ